MSGEWRANYEKQLARLNDWQRAIVDACAAATEDTTPVRVIACAGAGKTASSVVSIAHVLALDILKPEEIYVTTFTNKAAGELKERLERVVEPAKLARLRVGTWHALAGRWLRENDPKPPRHRWNNGFNVSIGERVPRVGRIWSAILGWQEIPGVFERHGQLRKGLDLENQGYKDLPNAKAYALAIDNIRSRGYNSHDPEGIERAEALQGPFRDGRYKGEYPHLLDAWRLYEQAKQGLNAFDFEDVLHRYWELGQDSARLILVDEAQDNSWVQLDIARKLARIPEEPGTAIPQGKLFLIGDVRQAIYSWRAADPEIMLHADETLGAGTLEIPTNYRSGRQIVEVGNEISRGQSWSVGMDALPARRDKGADGGIVAPDGLVRVREDETSFAEAQETAREIRDLLDGEPLPEPWCGPHSIRKEALKAAQECAFNKLGGQWSVYEDTETMKSFVSDAGKGIRVRQEDDGTWSVLQFVPPSEIYVLVRTNKATAPYEMACLLNKVPVMVLGANTSFFDRLEIQDALAYCQLSGQIEVPAVGAELKPPQMGRLEACLRVWKKAPKPGGRFRYMRKAEAERSLEQGFRRGAGRPSSEIVYDALAPLVRSGRNAAEWRADLDDFVADLQAVEGSTWKGRRGDVTIQDPGEPGTAEIIARILGATEEEEEAEHERAANAAEDDPNAGADESSKTDLVRAFASIAKLFDGYAELTDFAQRLSKWVLAVNNLANLSDEARAKMQEELKRRVVVSTCHKVKGLQASRVFVSATAGEFPHFRASAPSRLAEEQRLFYVAVTRAADVCTITNARIGSRGNKVVDLGPSVFTQSYVHPYLERERRAVLETQASDAEALSETVPADAPAAASEPAAFLDGFAVAEKIFEAIPVELYDDYDNAFVTGRAGWTQMVETEIAKLGVRTNNTAEEIGETVHDLLRDAIHARDTAAHPAETTEIDSTVRGPEPEESPLAGQPFVWSTRQSKGQLFVESFERHSGTAVLKLYTEINSTKKGATVKIELPPDVGAGARWALHEIFADLFSGTEGDDYWATARNDFDEWVNANGGFDDVGPLVEGWDYRAGSGVQAPLSYRGDYVISHRPGQYVLSYRPSGEHHNVGTYQTLGEAMEAAAAHEGTPDTRGEIPGQSITSNQFELLDAIMHSEYGNGADEGNIGVAVWTWSATESFSKQAAGGVVAKAQEAGLVTVYHSGPVKEHTIAITRKGFDAWKAYRKAQEADLHPDTDRTEVVEGRYETVAEAEDDDGWTIPRPRVGQVDDNGWKVVSALPESSYTWEHPDGRQIDLQNLGETKGWRVYLNGKTFDTYWNEETAVDDVRLKLLTPSTAVAPEPVADWTAYWTDDDKVWDWENEDWWRTADEVLLVRFGDEADWSGSIWRPGNPADAQGSEIDETTIRFAPGGWGEFGPTEWKVKIEAWNKDEKDIEVGTALTATDAKKLADDYFKQHGLFWDEREAGKAYDAAKEKFVDEEVDRTLAAIVAAIGTLGHGGGTATRNEILGALPDDLNLVWVTAPDVLAHEAETGDLFVETSEGSRVYFLTSQGLDQFRALDFRRLDAVGHGRLFQTPQKGKPAAIHPDARYVEPEPPKAQVIDLSGISQRWEQVTGVPAVDRLDGLPVKYSIIKPSGASDSEATVGWEIVLPNRVDRVLTTPSTTESQLRNLGWENAISMARVDQSAGGEPFDAFIAWVATLPGGASPRLSWAQFAAWLHEHRHEVEHDFEQLVSRAEAEVVEVEDDELEPVRSAPSRAVVEERTPIWYSPPPASLVTESVGPVFLFAGEGHTVPLERNYTGDAAPAQNLILTGSVVGVLDRDRQQFFEIGADGPIELPNADAARRRAAGTWNSDAFAGRLRARDPGGLKALLARALFEGTAGQPFEIEATSVAVRALNVARNRRGVMTYRRVLLPGVRSPREAHEAIMALVALGLVVPAGDSNKLFRVVGDLPAAPELPALPKAVSVAAAPAVEEKKRGGRRKAG